MAVEVFSSEGKNCASQLVRVHFYQVRLLNAKVSEEFSILPHVSCELCSCGLVSGVRFGNYFVGNEEASLRQEYVQEVKHCVLEQFPADDT